MYEIITKLSNKKVHMRYYSFVNALLEIVASIIKVHPHLILRIYQSLRYLSKKMIPDANSFHSYLDIFEHIISTKDSNLMTLAAKVYDSIDTKLYM